MRIYALALVAGMVALQTLPGLPAPLLLYVGTPLALGLVVCRRTRWAGLVAIGFFWAMWRADLVLDTRLESGMAGRVADVHGRILSAPRDFDIGTRFDIDGFARDLRGRPLRPQRIQITWYSAEPVPVPGAYCELKVRLSPPRGLRNPAGFDYEKWLFRRHIDALGTVVAHPSNTCEAQAATPLSRLREAVREHAAEQYANQPGGGIINALAIGDRTGLNDTQWSVLRDSGTAHLFAISGLHISLVAALAFAAVRWLISLVGPVARRTPAQHPAAFVAMLAATLYAALAGFPVSAQRALVMLAIVMLCVVIRRRAFGVDNYILALLLVAMADPAVLIGTGYWLSFGAVGFLLLIDSTQRGATRLSRLWRVHVMLAFAMVPVVGTFFGNVPLVAPLANIVAVPVVSFIVVPCILSGVVALPVSATAADWLWQFALGVWSVLWSFLTALIAWFPAAELPGIPHPAAVGVALLGVLSALIPLARGARLLGAVLVAVLLIDRSDRLDTGELRLVVLDVGQGLSAVVETATHVLVYDAGPARGRFSAGADVVAPVLRRRGHRQIDHLIISHGDADHAAGWPGLAAATAVTRTTISPGHDIESAAVRCGANTTWVWDRVEFTILHPRPGSSGSENDRSCVLHIAAPGGSVLLPGDIEHRSETALVHELGGALHADIVIAPHHGSRTSSTDAFIDAVAPRYVVFPAGFRNRFGFPHAEVIERYEARGVVTLTTGRDGAITFFVAKSVGRPERHRFAVQRYWHAPASDRADRIPGDD